MDGDIRGAYARERNRKIAYIAIMSAVAVAMFFITLGFGTYKISVQDAIAVFFDHISGNVVDVRGDHYVWDFRVPRAIAGILAGAGLAIGGVVMQNILRNPLAEPYTMGVSSGAMFGATLSIGLGISVAPFLSGYSATMVNAFVFSLVPTAIIMLIAMFRKVTPVMMILTGIAVMYLFSSVNQLVMVTASSESMTEIYSWTMGTLARADWDNIPLMFGTTVVLGGAVCALSKKMDIMYMGDRGAQSLGIKVNAFRLLLMALVSFLTASLVCCTGTIGFVGLVAPHVARIFVGSNNRYLLPASMAFGVAFILVADSLAKVVGNGGLPVGVISSLIGGPLFMYILIRQRKHAWM